jgi:hypothetical protein
MTKFLRGFAAAILLLACAAPTVALAADDMSVLDGGGVSKILRCKDVGSGKLACFSVLSDVLGNPISFADVRVLDWTINSATNNAAHTITLNNGAATTAIVFAGLTASGATITSECTHNDGAGSPVWATCHALNGATTFTTDGNYRWDVSGRTAIRFRISSIGTGTITGSESISAAPAAQQPSMSSGVLRPIVQADGRPFLNMTTATTTKIVTGVAGKRTYVTGYSFRSGGVTTGKLVSGTGSNCGTGTADLTETFDLAANDGQVIGSGLGEQFDVAPATDICVVNSAAQNLRASVAITQQ